VGVGLLGLILLLFGDLAAPQPAACPPALRFRLTPLPVPEQPIPILGLAPQAVAVSDFNLDGRPDLFVSYLRCDPVHRPLDPVGCSEDDRNGRIVLLTGQAEGGFLPAERAPRLTVGEAPRFITVGNFDHDCFPDVAVSNFGSPGGRGTLAILLNDQRGSFRSARPTQVSGNARGIVSGDFDNNGTLDLAVVISNRRSVTVLKGNGQGQFDCCLELPTGSAPQTIVAADFNNDGFLDLATANASSSNSVTILLNDQRGDFTAVAPLQIDDSPFDLAAGDLNNDGFVDIVTAHAAATDSLWVWLGDGKGAFTLQGRFPAGTDPIRVTLVHQVETTPDGDLLGISTSAIAVNSATNQLSWLLGDGKGNLGAPTAIAVGQTPIAVAVADLDLDGSPDFVTANQSSHDLTIKSQVR
jgi:hypothetical protein